MKAFRFPYISCYNRLRPPVDMSLNYKKSIIPKNLRTIILDGNKETKQMTPCFNLLPELALFLTFTFAFENSQYSFSRGHPSGFFLSNSLQAVNGCKNSVLNWVMRLNLLTQTPLKIFPFYSLIILTLWFRYLQTRNSKIPRKTEEKCISQWTANLNFKNFLFSVYHGQTAKKLNLWGNTAVDESVWINA